MKISTATNTAPKGTDKIPISRVASTTAYNVTVSDLRSGVIDIHAFGALGDSSNDDSTAINLALNEAASMGYGTTRPGGIVVVGHPGKVYRIASPIDLCNRQGITLDLQGSVLLGQTSGAAMVEIIGSQDIRLLNAALYGHATNSPGVGTWTARSSDTVHGTNSANITLENVFYRGYFDKACHYCIGSESNHLHKIWTYLYGNATVEGIVYVSTLNDLSMTAVRATLATTTYGNWDMDIHASGLTTGPGYTAIQVRDFCAVSAYQSYLYSITKPTIYLNGGAAVKLVDCGFEGTPDNTIQIDDGPYHNFLLEFNNVNLGTPNNYTIYAADNTIATNCRLLGRITPGLNTTYKPMRFYRAEGCDFSGLQSNDSRAFTINIDKGYSYECKFVLGNNDVLSYTNGAYSCDDFVENYSTSFDAYLQVPSGGVKFSADNRIVTVKKATAAWTPGLVAAGASALAAVTVAGVTADGTYTAMASHTGLDEGGWIVSAYPYAGGVYVVINNQSGGDITVPAGTLLVTAIKVA